MPEVHTARLVACRKPSRSSCPQLTSCVNRGGGEEEVRKRRRRKVIHADAVNEDCDREHATLVHKDYSFEYVNKRPRTRQFSAKYRRASIMPRGRIAA